MAVTLTTPRLRLAEWSIHDHDLLRTLAGDDRMVRFVGNRRPWSPEVVARRHAAALAHWAAHGIGWLTVGFHDRPEAVGLVSVTHRTAEESALGEPAIELGWWVAPTAWGRGVATEAVRAARDAAFGHTDLLYAAYQSGNDASGRVMTKLGMTHRLDFTDDDGHSCHVHALTRQEWRRLG
ncbi:GNAT family N-acetyltransferase [Saccharopolyspora erythraea]|uniref:GNAT family N-acetyltransferase n=1 Tax=Saccharopolyspora erythraea TaxID=1836 RepID=UPI001BACAA5B|nr:GNAT family N-acetyltransferase [Saccharopolyspora erythraea]QUH02875.1 GNAT family N-acetyltransferase [Saccharopolyspora erythraea]